MYNIALTLYSEMVSRLIVVFMSQCIHMLNHYCTHKTHIILYVEYISIKKSWLKKN